MGPRPQLRNRQTGTKRRPGTKRRERTGPSIERPLHARASPRLLLQLPPRRSPKLLPLKRRRLRPRPKSRPLQNRRKPPNPRRSRISTSLALSRSGHRCSAAEVRFTLRLARPGLRCRPRLLGRHSGRHPLLPSPRLARRTPLRDVPRLLPRVRYHRVRPGPARYFPDHAHRCPRILRRVRLRQHRRPCPAHRAPRPPCGPAFR
jgi:hypothetical protein